MHPSKGILSTTLRCWLQELLSSKGPGCFAPSALLDRLRLARVRRGVACSCTEYAAPGRFRRRRPRDNWNACEQRPDNHPKLAERRRQLELLFHWSAEYGDLQSAQFKLGDPQS